jgi:hypothetical protein
VEKKGTLISNVDPKVLREGRDLNMLFLHKQKLHQKEAMCTWILQAHMQITRHGWLTQAHPFISHHREWLCDYERYDGGDVFLGDDSIAKIIGRGKIKLKLMDGTIRTLPHVLNILGLARNLIFVSKMDDAGVKTMFEKETCRMVRREMVSLKGVWIGTLYKLQGSTISVGCNSFIVPKIRAEEEKTPTVSG